MAEGRRSSDSINWSRMTLDELVEFYERDIGDELVREGRDPTRERPSYAWLVEHGYSGMAYALREHHGLTVKRFIVDVVGVDEGDPAAYTWGIRDEETVARLEQYLDSRSSRHNLANSTIRSRRSRLARYVREYEAQHGESCLVERAGDLDTQPAEIGRAIDVFDVLSRELESADSKFGHLTDVNDWYLWLQNRTIAAYNPIANVRNEFSRGWQAELEASAGTKPALSAEQVGSLYRTADAGEERFMILALGAWGLRRSEVASLHVSTVDPSTDPPRLEFEDRKNGPGTVQLLYGVDDYVDRVEKMEDDEWNGYLFPSTTASAGHIAPGTVNNRFARVAERAGVTLEGKLPTPHSCRRFWYNSYLRASRRVLEQAEIVGSEQGSSSAEVVLENYIDEEQALEMRRNHMREALSNAFSADVTSAP